MDSKLRGKSPFRFGAMSGDESEQASFHLPADSGDEWGDGSQATLDGESRATGGATAAAGPWAPFPDPLHLLAFIHWHGSSVAREHLEAQLLKEWFGLQQLLEMGEGKRVAAEEQVRRAMRWASKAYPLLAPRVYCADDGTKLAFVSEWLSFAVGSAR